MLARRQCYVRRCAVVAGRLSAVQTAAAAVLVKSGRRGVVIPVIRCALVYCGSCRGLTVSVISGSTMYGILETAAVCNYGSALECSVGASRRRSVKLQLAAQRVCIGWVDFMSRGSIDSAECRSVADAVRKAGNMILLHGLTLLHPGVSYDSSIPASDGTCCGEASASQLSLSEVSVGRFPSCVKGLVCPHRGAAER